MTVLALQALGQSFSEADAKAYQECVELATQDRAALRKAIDVCRAPAEAGIPGAQYALGVALVDRNEAGDRTLGIEWLEKAAGAGNPAAAFALAGILLQEDSPASQERGRNLLKMSICAGYPYAVAALKQSGATRENLGCPVPPEENFDGEWIADLQWLKSGAVAPDAPTYQLKIVLSGTNVQVFRQVESKWVEVKPGRFKLEQLKQSAAITAFDSGWDFDGEWIESWTIQLRRVGLDEARVSYLRTVNNPHLPAAISWRTFSSISEGAAHRPKR
jgi:hypothetical protein